MNIYEGILNSASPMPAHCQHAYKCFTMSVQLDCSTTYKTLFANQYYCCMARKMPLKLIYYCTLLFMACYFDACNYNILCHISY